MLNYEHVDFRGLKRIDGYARYDGRILSTIDEFYKIVLEYASPAVAPLVGALIYDYADTLFGVIVDVDDYIDDKQAIYVAVINNNSNPARQGYMTTKYYANDGTITSYTYAVYSADLGKNLYTSQQHYTKLLVLNQALRDNTELLPGAVIGLQWFRDRLYAVADATRIVLEAPSEPVFPNDTISLDDGTLAKVLDSVYVIPDYSTQVLFLDTLDTVKWYEVGANVSRVEQDMSLTFLDTIAEDISVPLTVQIASFFQARTEQQTLDEDSPDGPYTFGWKFVDHGWIVPFKNGSTLFGSLPSINQNIQGVGISGPTDTSGDNGRPLLLLQKPTLTNGPLQVNGWKDSDTPASYELNAANVKDDDSSYVYADAFISWDGESGEVSAPGLTDNNLVEYSVTNTVDIDL